MMLIPTSERCPECDALVYMKVYQKKDNQESIINVNSGEHNCFIADGVYLDLNGVMCITYFDEDTRPPDYYCIYCRWIA